MCRSNWPNYNFMFVKKISDDIFKSGKELGEIIDLVETGSNDVLLLKDSNGKSLAIPWLADVIIEVDTEQSLLIADWEPLI